ncbi:hypothetical protein Taro_006188 [Colocasia esculenta]|uniref:Uncharacterized protein n=1 Tax=Colocasia esculenta TaxID=4460 RepID=A0A843TUG3_COLES|nr:hypothetical protein [Colocasia esculenta]
MSLGASGLLLHLAAPRLTPGPGKKWAESAGLLVMFLSFITGKVMAVYAVLLSRGVVPAVSTGLAKKLSWIPLALAIEAPPQLLVCTPAPMLLRLQIVGGGRAAVGGPGGGEPAGDVQAGGGERRPGRAAAAAPVRNNPRIPEQDVLALVVVDPSIYKTDGHTYLCTYTYDGFGYLLA